MTREKLIQLPNEDWIAPSTVREVRSIRGASGYRNSVLVVTENGAIKISCEEYEQAITLRDAIAQQINAELDMMSQASGKRKARVHTQEGKEVE